MSLKAIRFVSTRSNKRCPNHKYPTLLLTLLCLLAPLAYSVDEPTETPAQTASQAQPEASQTTEAASTSETEQSGKEEDFQQTESTAQAQPAGEAAVEPEASQTSTGKTNRQQSTETVSSSEAQQTDKAEENQQTENSTQAQPEASQTSTDTTNRQQATKTSETPKSNQPPDAPSPTTKKNGEPGTQKSLDAVLKEIEMKNGLVDELTKAQEKLSPSEGESIRLRVLQYQLEVMRLYDRATDLVLILKSSSINTDDYIRGLRKEMLPIGPYIRRAIIEKSSEHLPDDVEPMSRKGIRFFEDKNSFLNDALSALSDHVHNLNRLGFNSDESTAYLNQGLKQRAESLSGEIQIVNENIQELQHSASSGSSDSDYSNKLYLANIKLDALVKSMRQTVNLLEANNLDAQEYKTLLISSTGRITREILEPKVFTGVLKTWINNVRTDLANSGADKLFNILVFLLVMLLFYCLAKILSKMVALSLSKSTFNTSQLMEGMINSLVFRLTMLVGFLVGLSQFGVSITPILAGLGIAGFIVGFALQDVLANFAAGVMIIVYRPYDIGDMIEVSGGFGKVKSMNLVSTTLLTIDNQSLIIPNSKIWGDVIKNVTSQAVRRVDMVFGISYGDSIEKAESVLLDILQNCEAVLKKPEPMIKVHTLNNSSVDFVVRPWVKTDDYWDVYWEVTRTVKERFDEEGISIPFPQRDVHLYRAMEDKSAEAEKESSARKEDKREES